jgi:hypothetical protein
MTAIEEIVKLSDSEHVWSLEPRAARAIVKYCEGRRIKNSVETGAGKSTLLLSHLSDHHVAFAIDEGGTVTAALNSPHLRRDHFELIEGATQKTLPTYQFPRLQLALIDGPHAYPFPDLEYYYIYPHLDPGALLIVDDIDIPTINNLWHVVSCDRMFKLLGVIGRTGFLERTSAPTLDPLTGWFRDQSYNSKKMIVDYSIRGISGQLLNRAKMFTPGPIRRAVKKMVSYR